MTMMQVSDFFCHVVYYRTGDICSALGIVNVFWYFLVGGLCILAIAKSVRVNLTVNILSFLIEQIHL